MLVVITEAQATALNSALPVGQIVAFYDDSQSEWLLDTATATALGLDVTPYVGDPDTLPEVEEAISQDISIKKSQVLEPGEVWNYNLTFDGHPDDVDMCRSAEVWVDQPAIADKIEPSELTPYDPENFSTIESRLLDANVNTYTYNNRVRTAAGIWFAVEANSGSMDVGAVKLFDYNRSANYIATEWAIDSKEDDDSDWVEQIIVADHTWSPNGILIPLPAPVACKYLRVRCITPCQVSYWILSELELYEPGQGRILVPANASVELQGNTTRVKNMGYRAKHVLKVTL